MNFEHDLASLKQRIAKAERSRDAWRAAGVAGEEHYLEACTTISALTLQMDKLEADPNPCPPQAPNR
jgi:hypothetical protein